MFVDLKRTCSICWELAMNTAQEIISVEIANTVLDFQHVLTATHADKELDVHGPVIRYQQHVNDLNSPERGVYLITVDSVPVYVGKYETAFSKRWLYSSMNMIYHHKRDAIAACLAAGKAVEVYRISEDKLRNQFQTDDGTNSAWMNVNGVERALIEMQKPAWNLTHISPAFVKEDCDEDGNHEHITIQFIDGPRPDERHLVPNDIEPGDSPVYVFCNTDDEFTQEELAQMQAIVDTMRGDELRELSDIISRLLTDDLRPRSGRDFVRNHPLLKFSIKDNGIVTYRLYDMRNLWEKPM